MPFSRSDNLFPYSSLQSLALFAGRSPVCSVPFPLLLSPVPAGAPSPAGTRSWHQMRVPARSPSARPALAGPGWGSEPGTNQHPRGLWFAGGKGRGCSPCPAPLGSPFNALAAVPGDQGGVFLQPWAGFSLARSPWALPGPLLPSGRTSGIFQHAQFGTKSRLRSRRLRAPPPRLTLQMPRLLWALPGLCWAQLWASLGPLSPRIARGSRGTAGEGRDTRGLSFKRVFIQNTAITNRLS